MFDQSSKESLDSSADEPLSKIKCKRPETSQYCWNCFVSTKKRKKCSTLTCEQSFHVQCLSKDDKKNRNNAMWKCPDCQKKEKYEAFGESSSHSENINEMLQTVEKHLRDNSTLNKFDSGPSQIQEKLNAGKYESGLDFLVDIKKAIITFFNGSKSDEYSRRMAKVLVEECEKCLAPSVKHCFMDAFALIDNFSSEMENFHSRLQTKLKVAATEGKMLLQNDMKRKRTEFNMERLEFSEEKSMLESNLKAVSDELLVVNTNNEKLQNDNAQLQIERDAATLNSNMLITENERLHSKNTSLKEEISRMQTDFDKELHNASEAKAQLESKLNEQFQNQLENEKRLMRADYDLELIKASDEKREMESKLSLVETNLEKVEHEKKMLVEELKKGSAERDTFTTKREQLLEQSEKRLKAALHELNKTKVELKHISSENDRFLIERMQFEKGKNSLENEKNRMLTELCEVSFQEKMHAIAQDVNRLKLSLRSAFDIMKNSVGGVNNDLSDVKSNFERLQDEILVLEETKKDHSKLQADLNMEHSMSKIQIDVMQRRNSDLDAQNLRLNIDNTKLKQQIDELKQTIEHGEIGGLSTRIKALEMECDNLKKQSDSYRARWKHVKSKLLTSNSIESED